ncbi:MAG TPA: N(4)-(beta-N-acetylglucosaminyl)-L-asparaginase [Vicinamibacterales bacterium]
MKRSVPPVVVASANGHTFKNGGTMTCVEKAFALMTDGRDVLDALIAGVNIVELDPDETSVGYGGLPNAEGVVQLDACCMHGPKKGAGGVAALEGVKTASSVAQKVMEQTTNLLLAGTGAQDFARRMGFEILPDLNTEKSRKAWLRWKAEAARVKDLPDAEREQALWRVVQDMANDRWIDRHHVYGTINCNGINANGEIGGVTTTSGLAFKIPGRVGDSPVLGAGLYVDGEVGAAGSTGLGEANLYSLTAFFIVECMRRGMHPKDAGFEGLRRIKAQIVTRLQKPNGDPNFSINFYVLNAKGEHAGVSMYGGEHIRYAVCDEKGARTLACEPLLQGAPTE